MLVPRTAFTLIELLVVITIIVVLLALLTPALDKAIFQAELVACAANQKLIGGGSTLYAFDFRRNYPHRPTRGQGISIPMDLSRVQGDDRPIFKNHIVVDAFLDPFVEPIDLSTAKSHWVQSGFYSFWVGTRYPGERGLMRVGDRFGWTVGNNGDTRKVSFGYLAGDSDAYTDQNGGTTFASHPDDAGRMQTTFAQDALPPAGAIAGAAAAGQNPGVTASYWILRNGAQRGLVDMNFAHVDGSVVRFRGVRTPYDDRMESVPLLANANNSATWRTQVPPH